MDVTGVKISLIEENRLRAYVSIIFDHCFIVRDLKIIQGHSGLFVSMPSRRNKDGSFRDIAHPLNTETRRIIEDRVLTAYKAEVKQRKKDM